MIRKYYDACVEAGLPEEKIRAIDQVFDADKKRLKRRDAYLEKHGIVVSEISALSDGSDNELPTVEFEDKTADIETAASISSDIDVIKTIISEFSESDRTIIMTYCGEANMNVSLTARLLGINKRTCSDKVKKLISTASRRFFEISKCDYTDAFKI